MEIKTKRILEALQIQPLSQEEMTARHILGRLYGPIATCIERTRNDRLYNKPLWEKALKDEIFLEKVATKALFLELGHPADREETDMKQACACIPEVPKIVGDDLYAYVDILDTPNGRLLKTLVDYGFIPGISSRGSGDVMENNQVDPETFFLETWDIVQLPAVKKARLNVYESLDSSNLKLKKALIESYNAAKEEDKDTMKKALENLNIDINSDLINEELTEEADSKVLTAEDIPWDPDAEEVLTEETEETEETAEPETDSEETLDETETVEETEDNSVDENDETNETDNEETAEQVETLPDLDTVSDAVEMLQEYDDDTKIAFEPIQIDGAEYEVEKISSFVDENDDTLIIGVDCVETTEETSEEDTDDDKNLDEAPLEETSEESVDTQESAEDDGDVEVIESLKEMIRQKETLETEVSSLRKAKTVGDAKEKELQEKIDRYRHAFKQATAEAAKVPMLMSEIKTLTEKLTQTKAKVKTLTEQVNNTQQLKESADSKTEKISRLNEEISRLTNKSEALEASLEGQTKQYKQKLQERTNLAKTYKMRFIETITKYVESKASMLGVQPSEITSRLNENYTLSDVDAVCDQILESTISFSRLPFGGRTQASARISESVSKPVTKTDFEYGYEIDDSLLELAGLKK